MRRGSTLCNRDNYAMSFFKSVRFDGNGSAYQTQRDRQTDGVAPGDCQLNEAGMRGNDSEPAAENSLQS